MVSYPWSVGSSGKPEIFCITFGEEAHVVRPWSGFLSFPQERGGGEGKRARGGKARSETNRVRSRYRYYSHFYYFEPSQQASSRMLPDTVRLVCQCFFDLTRPEAARINMVYSLKQESLSFGVAVSGGLALSTRDCGLDALDKFVLFVRAMIPPRCSQSVSHAHRQRW